MLELKAEKERLLSLSREKAHADKLKERINDLKSVIAAREIEYEDSKQKYDVTVEENRKFYERYSNFREIYTKVEKLEEHKATTTSYLLDVKSKYKEIPGKCAHLCVSYVLTVSQVASKNWNRSPNNLTTG